MPVNVSADIHSKLLNRRSLWVEEELFRLLHLSSTAMQYPAMYGWLTAESAVKGY